MSRVGHGVRVVGDREPLSTTAVAFAIPVQVELRRKQMATGSGGSGSGGRRVLGGFTGRTIFIGLAMLVAAVLFAACGNDPEPATTEQGGAGSASTNPETAASGEPAATPAPATTDSTAATRKPTAAAAPTPRPRPTAKVDRNPGSQTAAPPPAPGGPSRRARIRDRRRHTMAGPV